MVAGDDDQGVGVLGLVVQRHLHGLVELDEVTDGAADVGGVLLLVDHRALGLQEEPVGVVEQLDRLLGHRREVGLVAAVGVGAGRGRPARARRRVATSGLYRGVMLPVANSPSTGPSSSEVTALESPPCPRRGGSPWSSARRRARCRRRRWPAAKRFLPPPMQDVDLVVDELLGDRAEAGGHGRLLLRGARRHVGRALAAALADVRGGRGRGGVGDLRGGDVADELAVLLVLLEHGLVVLAGHVGGDARALGEAAVDGLLAGRPAAGGRGRVGDVGDGVVGSRRRP